MRTVAFYLPQYHPIDENNQWWGRGFTEWTNVTKARPLYRGHYQPFLPSDLGFYDLRCAETRYEQSELAKSHGVSAFCYWHYWFGGRRILERPFSEVLSNGEPNFPFCLGWANQTWSGTWHGAPDRILIEQTYLGVNDNIAHFEYLAKAFSDERYLKVDGKPVFYIFRPEDLPEAKQWSDDIRNYMVRLGFPGLYLVGECSDLLGMGPKSKKAAYYGFDSMVYMRMPVCMSLNSTFTMRVRRKFFRHPEVYSITKSLPRLPSYFDVKDFIPCVYSNWDNTPRSGRRGLVIEGACPEVFEQQLLQAMDWAREHEPSQQFVFIKSWNEWAEGNVLEPSLRFGNGFLEAHMRAISRYL